MAITRVEFERAYALTFTRMCAPRSRRGASSKTGTARVTDSRR